ncbi:uncharacterized protein RCC_02367 [Ramularia collo-cygni]|uniref:Uncharacterized protein n=1 Tax=Ramularia collo-cygni TaxID=112498 RepID=A0A2D3UMI1_9PEZI|nr:uncharacterized protein RCC_02367 [Ramularia collo-cygni]CZT16532.1 uncharacterized protein RCC_02367 [Ramularia collo-cygni]
MEEILRQVEGVLRQVEARAPMDPLMAELLPHLRKQATLPGKIRDHYEKLLVTHSTEINGLRGRLGRVEGESAAASNRHQQQLDTQSQYHDYIVTGHQNTEDYLRAKLRKAKVKAKKLEKRMKAYRRVGIDFVFLEGLSGMRS